MRIIHAILTQQPVFYNKGKIKRLQFQIENTTRDFLPKGLWRKIKSFCYGKCWDHKMRREDIT